MENPWKTLSIQEVYDNRWIKITHREVLTPAGTPGIYGVVHFKNIAIGIVPVDEQGYTWLVGQYRYTLDQYTWEIPEGGCPLGTDPLETAKRELKEETGIQASEWIQIIDFHTSNSVTDEYGIAYLAKGLSYGEAEPEETESLQLKRVPLQEAIDMVLRGEITDALSMMALMKVHISFSS
ncbi:NUDIX domain-containing protein [Haliscomenobacter hydrossis]|uniref:GDP-mannose pyrophosphatase n=1 Tax=Haliscomenobacter hydrossis (strain ATCC 27775 / DSM 1100 / LMG 10767 / O) TaxID=760192 RepID=F4KPZ9_HALH1|nr:NUDIX hydrolase [Haliscomenobacter hydrossis]AEE53203.1 NUDIX hydrolase [Haliscomenobacter hydrossis DSM 1100]